MRDKEAQAKRDKAQERHDQLRVMRQNFQDKLVCVQFRGNWLYVTGDAQEVPEPMQLKVETPDGPQVMPLQVPFIVGKLVDQDKFFITLRYKDERSQPHSSMLVSVHKDMIFTITVVESVEELSRIVVPT
jgi:hypothetical protein